MIWSVSSDNQDIRWKQRYQNFSRAFSLLREAIGDTDIAHLDQLQQEGVIQRFEYTFELAWKVLKDYLEYHGVAIPVVTPRSVIKSCAGTGLFTAAGIDGGIFLDMLDDRNVLSHTYDFERFRVIIVAIQNRYLPQLCKEYEYLFSKLVEDV